MKATRPGAKLQATGYDKAGRKQYLYHPNYRAQQEQAKFDKLVRFAEADGCRVEVVDTVGAGDGFAAAFLHGLSRQWSPHQIAEFANRIGAGIASSPGAIPDWNWSQVLTEAP